MYDLLNIQVKSREKSIQELINEAFGGKNTSYPITPSPINKDIRLEPRLKPFKEKSLKPKKENEREKK